MFRLTRAHLCLCGALALVPIGAAACRRGSPAPSERGPQPTASAFATPKDVQDAAEAEPATGPGPTFTRSPGVLPFEVFDSNLEPRPQLNVAVALTGDKPPRRAEIDALLRDLFHQAEVSLGKWLPPAVRICVFAKGARTWSTEWIGCLERGLEEDEDGIEIENHARFTPIEEAERLTRDLGGGFAGARKPRVVADVSKREYVVTYPLVDVASGEWLPTQPSTTDVTIAFFASASKVYPATSDYERLHFVGMWRDRRVAEIRVPSQAVFFAMDPWAMIERLAQAKMPITPGEPRSPEEDRAIRAEHERALEKLPKGSVSLAR